MSVKTNESERLGLLGHGPLRAMAVEAGEGAMEFHFDGGKTVRWRAEGDCCSSQWFADIENPERVLGHEILAIFEECLPHPQDDRSRQEVDSEYAITLVTENGTCQIRHRNSSNGYYGGSVWVEKNARGVLRNPTVINSRWRAPELPE